MKDWLAKKHYQLPIWSLCCPEFLPEWQLHQQSSLIFKVETGELRFKWCLIKTLTMMFVLRFVFGNAGKNQEIDPKKLGAALRIRSTSSDIWRYLKCFFPGGPGQALLCATHSFRVKLQILAMAAVRKPLDSKKPGLRQSYFVPWNPARDQPHMKLQAPFKEGKEHRTTTKVWNRSMLVDE